MIHHAAEISVRAQVPEGAPLSDYWKEIDATAAKTAAVMWDRCLKTVTVEQHDCLMAAETVSQAKPCAKLARPMPAARVPAGK
jgi:hypothetical protein